ALHEGHLNLVRPARHAHSQVIVSIFVNPRQFAPHEDYDRYPRPEAQDLALLAKEGVDAVFLPSVAAMYPPGYQTTVQVGAIADQLCGAFRSGHFDAVATVVLKLFTLTRPNAAYFGEKDYQQLHVVRQMVTDFNLPLRVVGVPTVREQDGLAQSSRNLYLTPDQRQQAAMIPQTLQCVATQVQAGTPPAIACQQGIERLLAAGYASIDYLELRDADSLAKVAPTEKPASGQYRLLTAARLGTPPQQTRLIDNLPLTL
ncbi:MAG: pantoate--beta-alanine ligase, partial [Alphaproteobacteria bacterium]|nr:pantoate--beta-alanine ligase [Alphaproteobacteria bacterium]